jgi:hypothetical protein
MAITPWYRGDTLPAWPISLTTDSGSINVTSLSSSNFSMLIHNSDTGVETTGTGSFTNLTAASGSTPASILYQPSSADVATLGNYILFVVITWPGGGIETLSLGTWQVIPK